MLIRHGGRSLGSECDFELLAAGSTANTMSSDIGGVLADREEWRNKADYRRRVREADDRGRNCGGTDDCFDSGVHF